MDIRRLTVEELLEQFKNGKLDASDPQIEQLVDALLRGRPRSLVEHTGLLWPDAREFGMLFMEALQRVLRQPPEQRAVAEYMGCDVKTLMRHVQIHMGIKYWREVTARLLTISTAAVDKASQ